MVRSREARRREAVNLVMWGLGAVAVLLFCLVIIDRPLVVWLNTNSRAVIAIVATVYAFLTLLLWLATRRQAEITRLTFEASHRPYVSAMLQEGLALSQGADPYGSSGQRLTCTVAIENHGSVPAALMAWAVQATFTDDRGVEQPVRLPNSAPISGCRAPHTRSTIDVVLACYGVSQRQAVPFQMHGHLEYRGIGQQIYRTDLAVKQTREDGRTQEYMMT